MLLGASVSHIFIVQYHYKLQREGLRYSHTIPRHPVGLMQHLSSGRSVCTLLWLGRCHQCSVALHIAIQKTALLHPEILMLSTRVSTYPVSWHPLSTWAVLSPLMITYYLKYTRYWTHVDCLAVRLFKAHPNCNLRQFTCYLKWLFSRLLFYLKRTCMSVGMRDTQRNQQTHLSTIWLQFSSP